MKNIMIRSKSLKMECSFEILKLLWVSNKQNQCDCYDQWRYCKNNYTGIIHYNGFICKEKDRRTN